MPGKTPNILLIMTDQQRPDTLGCYGNPVAITPNLDRLGAEGVIFDNMYVQNPLCVPSRYSMLTGRYPHCNRVRTNWHTVREGEESFGHQIGRAGYGTAIVGKMHLTPWHDNFGFDGRIIAEAKFDDKCDDDYQRFLKSKGRSRADMYDKSSETYISQATAVLSAIPQDEHIDTFVGRSTCEYLRNVDRDRPFCLVSSFLSPHNPYDPPEPYDQLFIDKDLPPRNMLPGEVDRKPREAYDYINKMLGWPYKTDELTDEQIHITKAYYYSLCTLVDDWVGRIVQTLKDEGLYEDTIIVFTSDHGDLMGDHGLIYKQCFYEQSVRVPFIVHAPKYFAPARRDDLCEMVDLHPTFCEMAGARIPHGVNGRSLMSILERQPGYEHRDAAFSENYFGHMVRMGRHKLVTYTGKPYGELYNLDSDPDEQINLWDDPDHVQTRTDLKLRLLDWLTETEDILPLPVRPYHYDHTPRDLIPVQGRAMEDPHQHWHLRQLETLYSTWDFHEEGILR